jgi:hypothetical protein
MKNTTLFQELHRNDKSMKELFESCNDVPYTEEDREYLMSEKIREKKDRQMEKGVIHSILLNVGINGFNMGGL